MELTHCKICQRLGVNRVQIQARIWLPDQECKRSLRESSQRKAEQGSDQKAITGTRRIEDFAGIRRVRER